MACAPAPSPAGAPRGELSAERDDPVYGIAFVRGGMTDLVTGPGPDEGGHAQALASIARGTALATVGSVVASVFGFVALLVMGRVLSQAEFGLLVLALNVLLATATVTVAGADLAIVRYVAAARAPGAQRGAILTPLALVLPLNVALAVLVLVFAEPLAERVFGEPHFADPLRAIAVGIPLTVLGQLLAAAVGGLERVSADVARRVVEQGARLVLLPAAVAIGFGVTGAAVGVTVAAALSVLTAGALLARHLPRGGATVATDLREVVAFAWPQAIAGLAPQVWSLLMLVFLAQLAGPRAVAVFGAALALARAPKLLYYAFTYRFSPTISRLWEERRQHELHALLKSVTRWVAVVELPFLALLIAVPDGFIRLFGDEYRDGAVVLALFAIALLFDSLAGPVETMLVMTGKVRLELIANVVTTATVVPIAFPLIDSLGVNGAGIAAILYSVLLNGFKIFFVRDRLRMHPFSMSLAGPFVVAGVVAGGAAFVASATPVVNTTIVGTAGLSVSALALYALLLLRVIGVSGADRRALALAIRPER